MPTKIKDYLLDVRIHIGIGLLALAVMAVAYAQTNDISKMPVWGNIAMAVFLIVLIGNVAARLFLSWIIWPIITLFTKNRD